MAHSVVELDQFDTDVTVPDGGDARTAASVQLPFGQLTNRTKNMRKGIPGVAVTYTIKAAPLLVGASGFGYLSAPYVALFQTSVADAGWANIPLRLPTLGKISAISLHLGCLAGHSALPATKPRVRLYATIPGGSSGYVAGVDVTDAPASLAAYEADHALTASGLSVAINTNAFYHLEVNGETGANSQANLLRVYGATITIVP